MEKLSFYDVKMRKNFETDDYEIKEKHGKRMAVAIAPQGNKAYRFLGKADQERTISNADQRLSERNLSKVAMRLPSKK